jgi:hypothetical protein
MNNIVARGQSGLKKTSPAQSLATTETKSGRTIMNNIVAHGQGLLKPSSQRTLPPRRELPKTKELIAKEKAAQNLERKLKYIASHTQSEDESDWE